jgi:hypothetical protein
VHLKKVGNFEFGAFPECKTRNTCLVGYKKQYGSSNVTFVPLAGISVYSLLESGKILAVTGFQNVAPMQSAAGVAGRFLQANGLE